MWLSCDTLLIVFVYLGCSSLKTANISTSVIFIGAYAFYGYHRSTTCTWLPYLFQNLFFSVYLGCVSLRVAVIPTSVTYIGYKAFYGNHNLYSNVTYCLCLSSIKVNIFIIERLIHLCIELLFAYVVPESNLENNERMYVAYRYPSIYRFLSTCFVRCKFIYTTQIFLYPASLVYQYLYLFLHNLFTCFQVAALYLKRLSLPQSSTSMLTDSSVTIRQ